MILGCILIVLNCTLVVLGGTMVVLCIIFYTGGIDW